MEAKKSVVLAPQHCMVGCDNCAMGCLWDAITFPHNENYVKDLSRRIPSQQITLELEKKLKGNPHLVIKDERDVLTNV